MRAARAILPVGVALAFVLGMGAALAADGEILINQAKVNAGGITPGDTAGFPATLSRPGRYKLSSNLVVPGQTTGIDVRANDVSIDLNGFTISSNPLYGAYFGVAGSVTRLRVVNGTITGFRDGGVSSKDFAVVENMRLIANGSGVYAGQQARIRNNTISGGGIGVACGQCIIEHNVIADNYNKGIALVGSGSTVLENVLVGNGAAGIDSSSESNGYSGNILTGNNGAFEQIYGGRPLHPNVCDPPCP